jgi:UDP-N-acetylglucosamine 2-epimerase
MTKVLTVVGARPQFIKLAPFLDALSPLSTMQSVLVHTGQHYDEAMSQVFFDELAIPVPDYHFSISSQSIDDQVVEMKQQLDSVFEKEHPDCVVVFGDTNSTRAGAEVAFERSIPIVHIEAGLRSGDLDMPEERHRIWVDQHADYLSCPTEHARNILKREQIKGDVQVDGDIMLDALLYAKKRIIESQRAFKSVEQLPEQFILATVHRGFNTDDKLRISAIVDAFLQSDLPIVFPVHPRVRKQCIAFGLWKALEDAPHIYLLDPVGYLDMVFLLDRAQLVITDSGGLQKEAYFIEKPCVTLRPTTEWVETVACGANQLVTNLTAEQINLAVKQMFDVSVVYDGIYGDGNAAMNIVSYIKKTYQ